MAIGTFRGQRTTSSTPAIGSNLTLFQAQHLGQFDSHIGPRFNSACQPSPARTFREIRSTAWHAAPRYPPEVEMTVVAIWLEPTEQVLWSVADTRISAPGPTGGRKIMTDSGAKLFAIPIHCQAARMNLDFRRKTLYLSSIGYAFAGDVFPATMTFATASTFLQNLTTVGSDDPPRLSEIAAMIGLLGQRFSKEALGSSNGEYGKFTAAVFGWCPTLNRFAIYELTPRLTSSTFEMQIEETLPKDNLSVVSFGTGAARLTQQIDDIRQHGDKYNRTARIPKLAAEVLIEQDMSDVGGSLSIGAATRDDFRLYSYVTPIVKGEPEAKISFNGIDLGQEARLVGHYMISIDGIA